PQSWSSPMSRRPRRQTVTVLSSKACSCGISATSTGGVPGPPTAISFSPMPARSGTTTGTRRTSSACTGLAPSTAPTRAVRAPPWTLSTRLLRSPPGPDQSGSRRGARRDRLGGGLGPVQQRLAAEPGSYGPGFADGGLGGTGVAIGEQALRVIQQGVGDVVGGAMRAYFGHGGGQGLAGSGGATSSSEPRTGQITLRPQPRGDVPRRMRVEFGEQLADGSGVTEFVRDTDGERARPAGGPGSAGARAG